MGSPLAAWPWAGLGAYKASTSHCFDIDSMFLLASLLQRTVLILPSVFLQYLLYGPLVGKVAQEWREQGSAPTGSWCLHLLLLLALRSLTFQLWFSYGNMLFFTRRRRVVRDGVDFQQIDHEWDWYVTRHCISNSPIHTPSPSP